MKKLFSITNFMLVSLLLQMSNGSLNSNWTPTGPTAKNIQAATEVDNLAIKGSIEEKIIDAAQKGDAKKIATFLAAKPNLEAKNSQNRTALMIAAEKGYAEIVKILLDAGADVHTQDQFRWTALCRAADKNQAEIVKILIDRGAGSDNHFKDIFVSAVFTGNVDMVKALAGQGAHITCDIINAADGMTRYGNSEMRTILNDLQSKCNDSQTKDY